MSDNEVQVEQGTWDWPLQADNGEVKVHNDSEKFEVHLDAAQFIPNEIKVKVSGRHIDISAEHKSNRGSSDDFERKLTRRYSIPEDVNESAVRSWLSPRGYLVITADKKPATLTRRQSIIRD